MEQEIKTSKEWYEEDKHIYDILDPDGWDRQNYDYSFNQEKITKKEYRDRVVVSTLYCKSKDGFMELVKHWKERTESNENH